MAARAAMDARPARPTAAETRRREADERRQARHDQAARPSQAGVALRRIAFPVRRAKTVRRWLCAGQAPRWHEPPRGRVLAARREHLGRRWAEGCRNAARLWRELKASGFGGRPTTARVRATRQRKAGPDVTRPPATQAGRIWRPPCGRRAARLPASDPATLPAADRALVQRLLADAPVPAATVAVAVRLIFSLEARAMVPVSTPPWRTMSTSAGSRCGYVARGPAAARLRWTIAATVFLLSPSSRPIRR